jgi:hypothetical protein
MNHGLQPILSRTMIRAGRGPEVYSPMNHPELVELWCRFVWHHHDLALYHHAIYRHVEERFDALIDYIDESRTLAKESPSGEDEGLDYHHAKRRETEMSWESETTSVRGFADQLLLVGLWATVEQYCSRVLQIVERSLRKTNQQRPTPHRWDRLVDRFAKFGLDFSQLKSYTAVDECRVLNNKVKHVGIVDAELARYPAFASLLGEPLGRIELALQKYSDGVYEFVGHVMEAAENIQGLEGYLCRR